LNVIQHSGFEGVAAEHGVFFYYCGYFSQPIITASADAIQLRLHGAGVTEKSRRRVLSAFIEMAQNIVHYSADAQTEAGANDDEVRFGTILIAQGPDGIVLTCSNPVDRRTYERLDPKLRVISQMNLDAIRAAYREALRADGEAESKGGGLGLLTLARESTCPLAYSFSPSPGSNDRMVFELRIIV
jgi:hypothetical protein